MSSRVGSMICDAVAVCGLTLLALVSGCGGGGTSTPAATLMSIAINPSAATNIPKGATQQFTASGTFSDNSTKDITTSVTWASDNSSAVTISNTASTQGLATAVASSGTAHISASMSGITSPTVTVTAQSAALKSIAVTDSSSLMVNVFATDQFTATGTLTDGTTQNLTASVMWSSSTPANAAISGTGLATGVHSGTTMITASATGITSPAVTLTVVAALSTIAITPAPTANIPLGDTQNFSAPATFNDGTMQDITASCAWTSSNTAAVTIGANTGVAMAPNTAAVGATSNISCSAAIPAGTPTVTSNTVVATVTTSTLAITTSKLPPASVGTLYDQPIQTSGGDGTTITFALANGTNLPAWASLITSTGHITGTPAAGDVGTSAAFQISATQSGHTVTSGNLTITVVASPNAELKGTYAFLLRGFVGGHAIVIGGSFIADGVGNITGGVMDINDASSGPSTNLTINPAPASGYSVGADNRGKLALNTSDGVARTFDFSVGAISAGVASLGHVISDQATLATVGSAISGVFKKQDISAFNLTRSTGIGGDFAFLSEGADNGGFRVGSAGRVTINSNASLTNGAIDINDNGSVDNGPPRTPGPGPLTFTGMVDSSPAIGSTTGRGTMTLNITSGTSTNTNHQAFYVVSTNEVFFVSTNLVSPTKNLYGGSELRQSTTSCPTTGGCSFTNNVLSGIAVMYIQSNSGPGSVTGCTAARSTVQVGALTFTLATTSISGGFDTNACGTPSTDTASGTYAVAPNGRVTVTGGNHPAFLYMVDTNHGFLIGTNSPRVETGVGEPQAAPPFTVTSGGRAYGAESPAVSGSLVYSGVETVTAGTPNSITQTRQDQNAIQGGLRENVPLLNDTFTIDATGRITFGSGLKGYFINSTRTVVIVQSTDTTPTISISDNQ
jgi:trimeric autotransporter adhesin